MGNLIGELWFSVHLKQSAVSFGQSSAIKDADVPVCESALAVKYGHLDAA